MQASDEILDVNLTSYVFHAIASLIEKREGYGFVKIEKTKISKEKEYKDSIYKFRKR